MASNQIEEQIIDTWEINNRLNLYLINAIVEEDFKELSCSKGRNVGKQLAHIYNVRLMWIKQAMPELLKTLRKIEKDYISKKIIVEEIIKSGKAISTLIRQGIESNKIKGFKPHTVAFLGYIIAHEAHHRGQVVLSLKQSGHSVDKKILFGLWEWGTK